MNEGNFLVLPARVHLPIRVSDGLGTSYVVGGMFRAGPSLTQQHRAGGSTSAPVPLRCTVAPTDTG